MEETLIFLKIDVFPGRVVWSENVAWKGHW